MLAKELPKAAPDILVDAEDASLRLQKIQGNKLNSFLSDDSLVLQMIEGYESSSDEEELSPGKEKLTPRGVYLKKLKLDMGKLGVKMTGLETKLIDILKLEKLYDEASIYKNRNFLVPGELKTFNNGVQEMVYPYQKEIDYQSFHSKETLDAIQQLPSDIQYILDKMSDIGIDYKTEGPKILERFEKIEIALNAAVHLIKNASEDGPKVVLPIDRSKLSPNSATGVNATVSK
jgi:hypothetical protein